MTGGLCLIIVQISYQSYKSKATPDSPQSIERLVRRYDSLQVLYRDFCDISVLRHGYMFVLVFRDAVISLIIPLLISLPLLQSILITCSSALMCIYLVFRNPFRRRFDQVVQIFFELAVLTVYICTSKLATYDLYQNYTNRDRARLERAIIVINILLKITCSSLVGLKVIQLLYASYINYSNKKKKKCRVHQEVNTSALNENSISRTPIKSAQETSFINTSLQQKTTKNQNWAQAVNSTPLTRSNGPSRNNNEVQKEPKPASVPRQDAEIVLQSKQKLYPTRANHPIRKIEKTHNHLYLTSIAELLH